MDDPNEENIRNSWVIINSVDIAEEATVLDAERPVEINQVDKNLDNVESDIDSDGISIISESSNLQESTNDEEQLDNNLDEIQNENQIIVSSTESASKITNWTFVDSETTPKVVSSNQFYLNCLQEPVQELQEHELGSVQSDLESDGISVISDYDSMNDFVEENVKIGEVILSDENTVEITSKLYPGIRKYCNGVLLGTILLATTSIFLGQYFRSVEPVEEDLPIYPEEFNTDIEENLPEKIHFQEMYDVPTALVYCEEKHKSANELLMEKNVKKCLAQIEKRTKRKKDKMLKEEEYRKLEKLLRVKEKYLDEKEKFLIKKEYDLQRAEITLKKNKCRKVKDFEISDKKKIENSLNGDLPQNKKYAKEKWFYKKKHVQNDWKYKQEKMYNKHEKGDGHEKYQKKKIKNVKTDDKENKSHMQDLEKKKSDDMHKNESKANRIKDSTNYIILENDNDNQTISGYWVGKLYKGRSHMRNKKHNGQWYFDRAFYRKIHRIDAKWYFNWMKNREFLRYKRTYEYM